MRESDIALLRGSNWLNDACINFCLLRLEAKMALPTTILLMDPAIVAFMRLQVEDEEEREQLARGIALSSRQWIVAPVSNQDSFQTLGSHWSLLAYHIPSNSALHFDSSAGTNTRAAKSTAVCLQLLLKASAAPDTRHVSCPQQTDSYNCGVYAVLFAKTLATFLTRGDDILRSPGLDALLSEMHAQITFDEVMEFRQQAEEDIWSLAADKQK